MEYSLLVLDTVGIFFSLRKRSCPSDCNYKPMPTHGPALWPRLGRVALQGAFIDTVLLHLNIRLFHFSIITVRDLFIWHRPTVGPNQGPDFFVLTRDRQRRSHSCVSSSTMEACSSGATCGTCGGSWGCGAR
jgi:hypothetical protein